MAKSGDKETEEETTNGCLVYALILIPLVAMFIYLFGIKILRVLFDWFFSGTHI